MHFIDSGYKDSLLCNFMVIKVSCVCINLQSDYNVHVVKMTRHLQFIACIASSFFFLVCNVMCVGGHLSI